MKFSVLSFTMMFMASVGFAQNSSSPSTSQKGFEAFKRNVYPIIRKQCITCHDDGGKGPNHSSSDPWVSYQKVLSYTNFGNLKYSRFIQKGTNGHGNSYGGNVTVTQDELITVFQKWWDQGENTSFLQGKQVLKAQVVPSLPKNNGYTTMTWDLAEINQKLDGVKFLVDIQRFMSAEGNHGGAYKIKNPRIEAGEQSVKVKGLHVVINSTWDSMANNYADIQITTEPGNGGLSQNTQIILERQGEGKDLISFAFERIALLPRNAAAPEQKTSGTVSSSKSDGQGSSVVSAPKGLQVPAFDESKVGVASRFVKIKPATFEMGTPEGDPNRNNDEKLHKVRITKPFEIQSTLVTQIQWYLVMGNNPSYFSKQESCDPGQYLPQNNKRPEMCKDHPVEQVSWEDIQGFIKKLNSMQGDYTYSLPTEAQYEYVARSGLPPEYSYGWGPEIDGRYVWFSGNSQNRTHAVATKESTSSPSNFQDPIYDISGNVWEWIQDWYGDYPSNLIVTDPVGPATGSYRVMRGGSWALMRRTCVRRTGAATRLGSATTVSGFAS